MATNKNASFRYRVLDACFRNRARKWTLESLIDEVSDQLEEQFGITKGISKRQLQDDINIMRSLPPRGFDAPIRCKEGCYYYDDPDFSIEVKSLNERDIESLTEAIQILNQFKGLAHFQELETIIAKIEGKRIANNPDEQIIAFELIEVVKGYEWLEPLRQAILQRKPQIINYRQFDSEASETFEMSPYHLKEYRGRWYVFGWEKDNERIYNFPLDRIIKVQNGFGRFKQNTALFNPSEYFKDIVGVTRPEGKEPEKVIIRVDTKSASYVRSKLMHHTQTIVEEHPDYIIFCYYLIPNFEFNGELFRLGDAVEVVAPVWLRDYFRQTLSQALERY